MAKALTNDQKREWAQILYTKERLTGKEIAAKVGCAEKTITAWKQKYGWDTIRTSLLVTKAEQIRRLYGIVDELTKLIETSETKGDAKKADMLVKYTSAINALETETSLAEIIEVAQRYINFIRKEDLEFAKKSADWFDAFIQNQIK